MATFSIKFQPPVDNPLWAALVIQASGKSTYEEFKEVLREVKALEVERFYSEEYEEEWVAGEHDPFTIALLEAGYTSVEVTEIPSDAFVLHADELVA